MNTIQTWTARAGSVTALGAAALLGFAGVAHADFIQDNITDDNKSVVLEAGSGKSGTAGIKLVGNNAQQDPDPGCNIDPGEAPLVLDIHTPVGVTANPDPLSIPKCDTFFYVSFTADSTAVSGNVTVTVESGPAGGGTYISKVDIPILVEQPAAPPAPADIEPPTIRHELRVAGTDTLATKNAADWYNQNLDVDFTCADTGSDIDLNDPEACKGDTTLTDGTDQSVTGTAKDRAGNTATHTVSGINIDTMKPSVEFSGGPAARGEYNYGSVPAAPTCNASDERSGLAGPCVIGGGGTTVGTHTYTATATDKAGNTKTDTLTYTVLPWTLQGFHAPVDKGSTVNTVKGGSTVPMKFEVFAGATELTSTSAVSKFTATKVSCSTTAPLDEIEVVTSGSTALRYDSTGGQFIQNWQTPKTPGTCYQTTVTTEDGSKISALFQLK